MSDVRRKLTIGSIVVLAAITGLVARGWMAGGNRPRRADRAERPQYSLDSLPASLQARADELGAVAMPCVRLEAVPAKEPLDAQASKFGGTPGLGSVDDWPKSRSGKPMTFVGQLNFAEIAGALAAKGQAPPADMPVKGILLFFYDMDELASGGESAHRDFWRFIWVSDPAPVEPLASLPRQEKPPKPCRIDPSAASSIPSADDDVAGLPDMAGDEFDDYCDLADDLCGAGHQVLGYARAIRSDPRWDAVTACDRIPMDDDDFDRRPAPAVRALSKWRLLWQIPSDEPAGLSWGDSGDIYILIRDSDLKSRRFDNLWVVMQCD